MYRCEKCDAKVPSGEKANKIVTAIRKVRYTSTKKNEFNGYEKNTSSYGKEIVSEAMMCGDCNKSFSGRPKIAQDIKDVNLNT